MKRHGEKWDPVSGPLQDMLGPLGMPGTPWTPLNYLGPLRPFPTFGTCKTESRGTLRISLGPPRIPRDVMCEKDLLGTIFKKLQFSNKKISVNSSSFK